MKWILLKILDLHSRHNFKTAQNRLFIPNDSGLFLSSTISFREIAVGDTVYIVTKEYDHEKQEDDYLIDLGKIAEITTNFYFIVSEDIQKRFRCISSRHWPL